MVAHAMRKNFAFPLAVFVMSLALYLRSFFGSDKIRQLTALKSGGSATLELLRESGKFLIIGGSDNYMLTDILYFYTAAVVVLSAALGIMLFRFVSSRAKNNIYFSLGISRAGLFSAHWLAGAVMLEAAVLLPLAFSAMLNLIYFGSSVMLWRTLLYIFSITLYRSCSSARLTIQTTHSIRRRVTTRISAWLSPLSGACCRVSICSRSTTTYSSARARWSRSTGSLKSPQTS